MRWQGSVRLGACLALGSLMGVLVTVLLSDTQAADRDTAALFSARALHRHALCGEGVELRRFLSERLASIKTELVTARDWDRQPDYSVIVRLTELIQRLDTRTALSQLDPDELDKTFGSGPSRASPQQPGEGEPDPSGAQSARMVVCPELYHGAADDTPLHTSGFVTENCKDAEPLETTITVLLPVTRLTPSSEVVRVVTQLHELHPQLPVIITAADGSGYSRLSQAHPALTVLQAQTSPSSGGGQPGLGALLNQAVRAATTPHVLVARELTHVTADLQLARHVRVLSRLPMVDVVGGASRNRSGHWRHGCLQAQMAGHRLTYRAGYQHSALECMLCDHVADTFAVRTDALRRLPLDAELPDAVVLHDWFLRARRGARLAAVCPDIMYYSARRQTAEEEDAAAWRQLAAKWQLTGLTLPGGRQYEFRCRDVGIRCNPVKTARFYSHPPCCLAQLERGLRLVSGVLTDTGVQYELEAGALLAAVKLAAPLPWGINTYIAFSVDDFWHVSDRLARLRRFGLVVEKVADAKSANATDVVKQLATVLRVHTPAMLITLRPERRFSSEQLPAELRRRPTLVRLGGVWLRAHTNPGRYARNRYGYDCLKHAVHWRYADDELVGEYSRYAAGIWPACPSHHHACLDQMPVDGSIGVV